MIINGTISVYGSNSRYGSNYGKNKIYSDVPVLFIKLSDNFYVVQFKKQISVRFEAYEDTCIDIGGKRSSAWYLLEKGSDGIFRFVFDLDQVFDLSERDEVESQLPGNDDLVNVAWDYVVKPYRETDRNNMRFWPYYNELELTDIIIDNR